jgi:predicted anti-sigma-YlaC factor YlaD
MKTKRLKIVRCKDVAKHLCENLDQQLNSRLCREIKKHLQECPNCTAYLDSLKKTISMYRSVSTPRMPNSAHKRLYAVLKLKH